MTDDFAIAAAVHYDFELATNPEPFEQLVHDLFGISSPRGEFIHWSTPLKGKRSAPPPAFDLSKLVRRVRRGVASAAVESLRTADCSRVVTSIGGELPTHAE